MVVLGCLPVVTECFNKLLLVSEVDGNLYIPEGLLQRLWWLCWWEGWLLELCPGLAEGVLKVIFPELLVDVPPPLLQHIVN